MNLENTPYITVKRCACCPFFDRLCFAWEDVCRPVSRVSCVSTYNHCAAAAFICVGAATFNFRFRQSSFFFREGAIEFVMSKLPQTRDREWKAHQGAVLCCTFNSDGNYILSGGHDKIVRLWNHNRDDEHRLVKEYAGPHGYEIREIAVYESCGMLEEMVMVMVAVMAICDGDGDGCGDGDGDGDGGYDLSRTMSMAMVMVMVSNEGDGFFLFLPDLTTTHSFPVVEVIALRFYGMFHRVVFFVVLVHTSKE